MNLSWRELNRVIKHLPEEVIEKMISEELEGRKRVTILTRLQRRYNKLHNARLFNELRSKTSE